MRYPRFFEGESVGLYVGPQVLEFEVVCDLFRELAQMMWVRSPAWFLE